MLGLINIASTEKKYCSQPQFCWTRMIWGRHGESLGLVFFLIEQVLVYRGGNLRDFHCYKIVLGEGKVQTLCLHMPPLPTLPGWDIGFGKVSGSEAALLFPVLGRELSSGALTAPLGEASHLPTISKPYFRAVHTAFLLCGRSFHSTYMVLLKPMPILFCSLWTNVAF